MCSSFTLTLGATMPKCVYSPFGVFVVFASFPFTEYEAQHWISYPSDKPDSARVFPCDTEQQAFELSVILA